MWNTGNSWQPWANQDLNYRPVRRPKAPYTAPNGLYNNFLSTNGLIPDNIPASSYEFRPNGDTWRAPSMLEMSRPNLPDRVDYWSTRISASKVSSTVPHQELWKDFGAPPQPVEISLLTWKSAKECGVKWNIPIELSGRFSYINISLFYIYFSEDGYAPYAQDL